MDQLDALVADFQKKDVNACEKLHQLYSENIRGAINVIVQNEEIAQEICQDVFLTIWQKSETYNASKGRFFTWLLNIAKNKAIDYTRSKIYKEQKKNHSIDFFVHIYDGSSGLKIKKRSIRDLSKC